MKTFSAVVSIRAPKDQVWAVLTKGEAYRKWNPAIAHIAGVIGENEQLTVYRRDRKKSEFNVRVDEYCPSAKMSWRWFLPLGVVSTRTFLLRSVHDGLVEFEMRENFTGLLAEWWLNRQQDWQKDFDQFAVAVKIAAEKMAAKALRPAADASPAVQNSWSASAGTRTEMAADPEQSTLAKFNHAPEQGLEEHSEDNTSLRNLNLATSFFSSYSSTNDNVYPELAVGAAAKARTQNMTDPSEATPALQERSSNRRSAHPHRSTPRKPKLDPTGSGAPAMSKMRWS